MSFKAAAIISGVSRGRRAFAPVPLTGAVMMLVSSTGGFAVAAVWAQSGEAGPRSHATAPEAVINCQKRWVVVFIKLNSKAQRA